jgi:cytochrome c biogenesis protein CcdA
MNAQLYPRLGTFFILVGCGLIILFFGSAFAGEFNILYLLFAAATLFLGFMFHRMAPHPAPTRFSAIRKLSQRSRQRKEEKQPEEDHEK